jgi:hypothetical protein
VVVPVLVPVLGLEPLILSDYVPWTALLLGPLVHRQQTSGASSSSAR